MNDNINEIRLDSSEANFLQAIERSLSPTKCKLNERPCGDICIPSRLTCNTATYNGYRESYKKANSSNRRRKDSELEVLNNIRLDRSKPVCRKGKPCGDICIPKSSECKIENSSNVSIAKPRVEKIEKYEINPETEEDYTIRDLKELARNKGISNYSYMTKDQLRDTLVEADKADKDPEQAERLVKTLSRDRSTPGRISRRLPRNKGTKTFRNASKGIRKTERILKDIGTLTPGWQAFAITSLAGGITLNQYNKVRSKYKRKFKDSAINAESRVNGITPPAIKKDNIAFVVGGMPKHGHSAAKMREMLETDDKLKSANHFIEFEQKEFGVDFKKGKVSNRPKDKHSGNGYLISNLTDEAKQHLKNVNRGQNEDAVELASQIYANYYRVNKNGDYANLGKTFNIVSGGAGNHVVDEALEVISRMRPPNSNVPINQLLRQINVVNLGGVHYGVTDPKNLAGTYKSITSSQDPYNKLPKINPNWISSVKSHHPESYLENSDVIEEIKRSWGMNRGSFAAINRTQAKKATPKQAGTVESNSTKAPRVIRVQRKSRK
jgi:hypothetical protein